MLGGPVARFRMQNVLGLLILQGKYNPLQKYSSPFFMPMLVAWATLSPPLFFWAKFCYLVTPKNKRSNATLTKDFLWKKKC
jgi:hypothetical protein